MKWKDLVIGIVLALCAGIGIYILIQSHKSAPQADDGEQGIPAVVTVQVGALERKTLQHYVEAYGSVEPAPASTNVPAGGALLAPPVAGTVAKVNVVEGQRVKKGDVLMELNSGTVNFQYAQQEFMRQQKLYAQHNTSLKNLQDAEAQLSALQVVAPLSGVITRLHASPGQAVDMNTAVAELADLNRLAVSTEVAASELSEIKAGDELQVLTRPVVTTTVSFISSAVNTSNNTVTVRGSLPPGSGLRPGQFVPVRIVTATRTNVLAAPGQSVVTDIDGNSVISLVKSNEAVQKAVQTGFREDGWVEVSAPGLAAGDKVVTVGAYALPDKTEINVVSPSTNQAPGLSSSTPHLQ